MKHVRWIIMFTIIGIIWLFFIGCSGLEQATEIAEEQTTAGTETANLCTEEPETVYVDLVTSDATPELTLEPAPTLTPAPTATPEPTPLPPLELTFETAQKYRQRIAIKGYQLLTVDETGTVSVNRVRSDLSDAAKWENLDHIAIAAEALFGVMEDGSVDCLNTTEEIRAYVRTLKDITDVRPTGGDFLQVVHSDGTAMPIILLSDGIYWSDILNGWPDQSDRLGISEWTDVIDYAATIEWIAGLTRDGTVYFQAFDRAYDTDRVFIPIDSDWEETVRSWTGIVEIGIVRGELIGVKEDGSIVSASKGVQDMFRDAKRIVLYSRDFLTDYVVVEKPNGGYEQIWPYRPDENARKRYTGIDWQFVSDISCGSIPGMGYSYTWGAVLYQDGTVVPFGDRDAYRDTDTEQLHDIESLVRDEKTGYQYNIACLRADGSVIVLGDNAYGQLEASDWTDIRQVKVTGQTVFGLRRDGTVICAGKNADGYAELQNWDGVRELVVTSTGLIGIKEDGTAVAAAPDACDVFSGRSGIQSVIAGSWGVGAVTEDGKWISTLGTPPNMLVAQEEKKLVEAVMCYGNIVALWDDGTLTADDVEKSMTLRIPEDTSDLKAIDAGYSHIAALKHDGTVICFGFRKNMWDQNLDYGQFDTRRWSDIVQIAAGYSHTVGLKQDGTVVATGENEEWNGTGRCEVSGWTDIVAVAAGFSHTVGLKKDGTVVATGENSTGCCSVDGWTDIVAIAAGDYYTVGIRRDGSILIAGFTNTDALDALPSLTPFDRIP